MFNMNWMLKNATNHQFESLHYTPYNQLSIHCDFKPVTHFTVPNQLPVQLSSFSTFLCQSLIPYLPCFASSANSGIYWNYRLWLFFCTMFLKFSLVIICLRVCYWFLKVLLDYALVTVFWILLASNFLFLMHSRRMCPKEDSMISAQV